MNIITTLLSTFFYNYIIILILSLLKVTNRRKVAVIIISIFNLGEALILLINMLGYDGKQDFSFWYYYIGAIGGTLMAYFITLALLLRGTRFHIKNRRQREFERSYDESKKIFAYIFDVMMVVLSLTMISLLALTIVYKEHIKNYIIFVIFFIIFIIIFSFLAIYSISIDFKLKDKKVKGMTLFFVKDNNIYNTYLYDGKSKTLEDNLGKLNEIYTFTNFGQIKDSTNSYNIIGIMPS
ncbi:MAG: hypothetical protein K6E20_04695, partial [Acholeplasmatales bacterium]|nr:hypothetical protein [Acholeplasmatales bacterium]